jgi:hypothetical protein
MTDHKTTADLQIKPSWIELLTHMLGAGKHIRKKQHGYRNYFCASVSDSCPDYIAMMEMDLHGLVRCGPKINNGTSQLFFATLDGCNAIGLSEPAKKRAMK